MSWAPWTTPITTILLVLCALVTWFFSIPKSTHLNLVALIACCLFLWAVAPEYLASESPARLYQTASTFVKFATRLQLHILLLDNVKMLVTGAAVLWLCYRGWQTLSKPVSELISILGVEVPDAPHVSLAGIRSNSATLHWTRPLPNRPVSKFLIQVNGVNVGESANQETAITVTGLKPHHYYNIRVVAVGHNNFQQGSKVIRLVTYDKDGRPVIPGGHLPRSFVPEEPLPALESGQDEDGTPRSPAAGVETASFPDTAVVVPATREAPSPVPLLRRNTLTRKHSPSTTSMDQSVKDALSRRPDEESLQRLGEKFERLRLEREEVLALIAKDEKEYKEAMDELTEEKKCKRRMQKEKDDTTEKLKREIGSTDRSMRSAQQRKTQKEKTLKDKQSERLKLTEDISRWERDIMQMRKRQAGFEQEKIAIQQDGDAQAKVLRGDLEALQASLAQEEAELKEKGKELKEAEDQRKTLPGGEESEEWRDRERQIRRDWEIRNRDLQKRLLFLNRRTRQLEEHEAVLRSQLTAAQQSGIPFTYNQANSSGVDFDNPIQNQVQNQLKRRSRNSTSLSNVPLPSPSTAYNAPERPYAASSFSTSRPPTIPPGFAPVPYLDARLDLSAPLDEDEIKALNADAPLSPNAAALLPAGMLDMVDDEPPSPALRPTRHDTFDSTASVEHRPQSPASSGRSLSMVSSPRGSSQNLPFPQYTENGERTSTRGEAAGTPSPAAPARASNPFNLLPWLHRGTKPSDDPPALGSLKPGQSQSFPRSVDDSEGLPSKRRISFSSPWHMFGRSSTGPVPESGGAASGPTPHRLGLFSHTSKGSKIAPDQSIGSPRPVSLTSTDLPRPSTDSGSIWGPGPPNRMWTPDAGDPWTSRSPSRRPSIHGSPSALKTTLASAEDEILDQTEIRQTPRSVGVIGTRPPAIPRLNPNAPSFMTSLFRPKGERDNKDNKDKERSRSKTKDKEGRVGDSSDAAEGESVDASPANSRKSKDALSLHTPSVASATGSRESLVSDQAPPSGGASDNVGPKESESSGLMRLLRRKESAPKFGLSIRSLGGKKGPSSVANSDKTQQSCERTSYDEQQQHEDNNTPTNANAAAFDKLLGRRYESSPAAAAAAAESTRDGQSSGKDKDNNGRWRLSGRKKDIHSLNADAYADSETVVVGEDGKKPS